MMEEDEGGRVEKWVLLHLVRRRAALSLSCSPDCVCLFTKGKVWGVW
jgi:hypothetical protein